MILIDKFVPGTVIGDVQSIDNSRRSTCVYRLPGLNREFQTTFVQNARNIGGLLGVSVGLKPPDRWVHRDEDFSDLVIFNILAWKVFA